MLSASQQEESCKAMAQRLANSSPLSGQARSRSGEAKFAGIHTVGAIMLGLSAGVLVFYPYLVEGYLSNMILAVLLSCMFLEICNRRLVSPTITSVSILLPFIVFPIVTLFPAESPQQQSWILRWSVVFPVAIVCGFLIQTSRERPKYFYGFGLIGAITVLLAGYERITASAIFDRLISNQSFEYFIEGGIARAVVGSSHPLVLGVLFAALVPWGVRRNLVPRACWASWMAIGAYCTGSEGPTYISIALVTLVVAAPIRTFIADRIAIAYLAFFAVMATLIYYSAFVWDIEVYGADSVSFSRGYREGMYSLFIDAVLAHPFGYLGAGIPSGEWLLITQYKGIRDLAVSIDSELVYLAFEWGMIGCAFFIVTVLIGLKCYRRSQPVALNLLALSGCGFFIATHAFLELGIFWMIAIGCAGSIALSKAGEDRIVQLEKE